jgi:hypothetical protein
MFCFISQYRRTGGIYLGDEANYRRSLVLLTAAQYRHPTPNNLAVVSAIINELKNGIYEGGVSVIC